MLPERTIHREDPLSEERKGPSSPHRLHTIVPEVGGGYGKQVRRVDRTNGWRALHHSRKGIAVLLIATVPTMELFELLCMIGIVAEKIRSEDRVLVRILRRLLATMLSLQGLGSLASLKPTVEKVSYRG